jgi:hypothetical protein
MSARSTSRIFTALLAFPFACSSGGSSTGGAGGSTATGGTIGTGGSTATGGSTGQGGSTPGSGGSTTGSGGAVTTGSGGAAGRAGATGGAGGRATTGTGGVATGTGGTTSTGGATGSAGSIGARASVLQHHNDLARDGVYVDAAFTKTAAAGLAADASFAGAKVTGNVYAQPLYLAGDGTIPDAVIVATEMNNVYAFNAATGAQLWMKSLGTPVDHPTGAGASGDLPCGNITPNVGVTGTPVIDPATRTIYLDAMTADTSGTRTAKHVVHALDAATGAEKTGWPVDLNATAKSGSTTFQSSLQNQRSALTLVGGRVIIPFSGHVGDCQAYHGWIVSITTSGTPTVSAWATRAVAGGIWGSSGAASDGTSVYFATGNSKSSGSAGPNTSSGDNGGSWGDSETVYKFPPSGTAPSMTTTTDYFVPSNWITLDDQDNDMGGTSPILVHVPGATPADLVVALGKDRNAYLLDKANLGGMDASPVAKVAVASGGPIIQATAAFTTSAGTFVVFKGSGVNCPGGQSGALTAFKIGAASPPTISVAWCGGPTGSGSPAVTLTDSSGSNALVWVVGTDNKVYGLDGATGTNVVTTSALGSSVQNIQTPIVANGRIFISSNSQVYALKP